MRAAPEDAAIVKRARAEWRRTARAERLRVFARRGATGLLAAAALVLWLVDAGLRARVWSGSVGPGPLAWVVDTTEAKAGLAAGDALKAGQLVQTEEWRAALRMASGAVLRAGPDTRMRLRSSTSLRLDAGTLYVESHGSGLEVWTSR